MVAARLVVDELAAAVGVDHAPLIRVGPLLAAGAAERVDPLCVKLFVGLLPLGVLATLGGEQLLGLGDLVAGTGDVSFQA